MYCPHPKDIFSLGGCPIPGPDGGSGYPIPGLDGRVPHSRFGWGGYPIPGPDGGYPIQDHNGGYPLPLRLDGGTPLSRTGWGIPLSRDRSAWRALAARWTLYLLRSRRRTFLFPARISKHIDCTPLPLIYNINHFIKHI